MQRALVAFGGIILAAAVFFVTIESRLLLRQDADGVLAVHQSVVGSERKERITALHFEPGCVLAADGPGGRAVLRKAGSPRPCAVLAKGAEAGRAFLAAPSGELVLWQAPWRALGGINFVVLIGLAAWVGWQRRQRPGGLPEHA
ncbi:MAG: hypothetical protein HY904_13670 [Deltaproteobacteria bacterium]|nr:hypothetical protein [Deltaproteobacteria bacterium]